MMIVNAKVEGLGSTDENRQAILHPFARRIDGELWGCVTDGHAALFWRNPGDLPEGNTALEKVIPAYDHRNERCRVDLVVLLRWLNSQVLQNETTCETCNGMGTHHCECGTQHQCGKCKGNGQIVTPRYVDLAGKVIPLPRLAAYLHAIVVESEVVVQAGDTFHPTLLSDALDRWRMLIMEDRDAKSDVLFPARLMA